MSRSGYSCDGDIEQWDLICWRGAVASAIKGVRGQAFLLEMHRAMKALPEPKLIAHELEEHGAVCAIGAVGKARGVDMSGIDPEDRERVANVFGIAPALAAEIVFMNDEADRWSKETPEQRYARMLKWIEEQLLPIET